MSSNRNLTPAEKEAIEQYERDLAGTTRSSTENKSPITHTGPAISPLPTGSKFQRFPSSEEREHLGGRNGSKKKKRRNKKKSLKKSEIRSKKPKKKKGTRRRKV